MSFVEAAPTLPAMGRAANLLDPMVDAMSLDFSLYAPRETEVYEANITHNLGKMADAAGIYECLWQPQENGLTLAKDIIKPLKAGIERLKAEPARFREFNAPNGWGLYEHLLRFAEQALAACEENPDAKVYTHR